MFNQSPQLTDLLRDLTLTKQQNEAPASHLQQWELLDKNARIAEFRKFPQIYNNFHFGKMPNLL